MNDMEDSDKGLEVPAKVCAGELSPARLPNSRQSRKLRLKMKTYERLKVGNLMDKIT